jgi:endonuclease-3
MNRLYKELPPNQDGAPRGLTLENILAVDPKLLNELIWAVGFHNNKTKYIKATAEILRDNFGGDIPDTVEGLMSLPGVGPKMAYLCLSSAWGKTEGIGVDVHVHRITNLWGWHKTKGPEETRLALQAWLPKELWHEINWLLVGLGQTVCLPVGRRCGECDLGLRGLCKSAERSKVNVARRTREEVTKKDEEEGILEKIENVKVEKVVEGIPINADLALG